MQNTDAVISAYERSIKDLPEGQAHLPCTASEQKVATPLGSQLRILHLKGHQTKKKVLQTDSPYLPFSGLE